LIGVNKEKMKILPIWDAE